MKPLYNIFSSHKDEAPKTSAKILVDIKEKNSLVYTELIAQKANSSFESLEIGDYLIEDTIFERKTLQDFSASLLDKRLFEQLKNMSRYEKRFLILEQSSIDSIRPKIHENALRGAVLSILESYKTPIIFSKNEKDTAAYLILFAQKALETNKTSSPLRLKKEHASLEEQKQFILEGFPGIGPTHAKKLLEKFKKLKTIFSQDAASLQEKTSLQENTVKKFIDLLNN